MAVRTKKKTAVRTVKKKTAPKKTSSNGRITLAEKHQLAQCIAPGEDKCPLVNKKDSAFMYQQGCRAEACRAANRNYYQDYRARKAAEAAKKARARKRKAAVKKKATKKTAAKR